MSTVAILQESVETYRIRFFNLLYRLLAEQGIEMTLWVPVSGIPERYRSLPYLKPLRSLGRGRVSWAMLPSEILEADLVIQPQQVRNLAFLFCLLRRRAMRKSNAFWGHGKCFDPLFEKRLSEKLKRWFSRQVDWWFAYNDLSARIVRDLGFPEKRITSVMNSTDTKALQNRHDEIRADGLDLWRARLGIGGGPVGVFLGRLYFNKRVDFTLEAAKAIRAHIPTFELIVIGDGEDRTMVEIAAKEHSWIHYPGPKGDTDKVPYLALADVLLNPGVVGLVINDAMAMGLPVITTDFPTHSPEIDYLHEGINGIITRPWTDPTPFAAATIELLKDRSRLTEMKTATLKLSGQFSAEMMAENFASGIKKSLAHQPEAASI